MLGVRWRQRQTDKAVADFRQVTSEFGTFLGTRMRDSDERDRRLLDLQVSVERLTSRLVVLTLVLGAVGLVGVGLNV
jgi:hypothetical protein